MPSSHPKKRNQFPEKKYQKTLPERLINIARMITSNNQVFYGLSAVLLALLTYMAYQNAFIQDDAFISFRYAHNLVNGHGLVWNPGERVEGYTNFLWTLLMAIPIALGYGPVFFSQVIGVILFTGSLVFTYLAAASIFSSRPAGLVTAVLLGTNFTFSSYATGGLETQLQAFLVIASFYCFVRIQRKPASCLYYPLLSIISALSLLTRMDSAIPLAVIYITLLLELYNPVNTNPEKTKILGLLCLPVGLVIISWLVWKTFYYGSILPNTYYVKAQGQSVDIFWLGFLYLLTFFQSYFLTPFLFIGIRFSKRFFSDSALRTLVIIIIIWCAYIIYVGGDFMEFRFMVPILPLFFISLWKAISSLADKYLEIFLVIMVVTGSIHHQTTFTYTEGIETIDALNHHVLDISENWIGVGEKLYTLFGQSEDVTIAVTAAGAIPYYSQLPTIDMLGLNDAWIARNGIFIGHRPGHRRLSPASYLLSRRVNLVIGQPYVVALSDEVHAYISSAGLGRWGLSDLDESSLPDTLQMLEIPLDDHYKVVAVYLLQDDYIDMVINKNDLYTFDVSKLGPE